MGFLVGIASHSLWPYVAVPFVWLGWFTLGACTLFFMSTHPVVRVAGLIALACLFGVWRFELARPALPKNLKPLDPKGFGYVWKAPERDGLQGWLATGRATLHERAARLFPQDQAALLTGILYGDKGLSQAMHTRFQEAGLLHIIAVSGSNVTILVVFIVPVLLAFGVSRKASFLFLSAALILFTLFVQPSAAVVRAAIMGWLVELAPVVGRSVRASRLLLVAAVVFTLWHPWALFYDPSFALSFLAMAGLLTWGRWINQKLATRVSSDTLREIISSSISAALFTTPYTVWAFHQATVWSLPTGLIVLPLVPWVMATGALALCFPFAPFVMVARGFLDAILLVAVIPRSMGIGYWNNVQISWWIAMSAVLSLLWIWRLLQARDRTEAYLSTVRIKNEII